jgi:hypothetical protein
MKSVKFFLPVLFFLVTTASCTTAQNSPQKGENVWIIVNYIKESAKNDYEKWMNDIFFSPMKTTNDPLLKQQYATTRWLTPAKQNDDKTWTYVFVMDPVIPNGDYDIESYLVKTYGEQTGKAYNKQFEEFMAKAGQMHVLNR